MTDQLRALAESEAKNEFHPDRQPFNLYDARRLGYVRGFIAGRTSVTREQIAEVLEGKLGHAHRDAPYADLTEEADAVLALLRGEVAV